MSSEPVPETNGLSRAWRWAIGAAALVLLVGIVVALARPRSLPVQVVEVKRGDLLVPIQCDGTLEPPPGGELRAAEAATVAEILAREGERVAAGRPLLRLDSADLSQKALDARSEALRLEAERTSAAADLAQLERQEASARKLFDANARLLVSGAITGMAYESAELALRQAEDQLRAGRARLAALDGGGRGAPSRLALARRAAEELERRVAALTARSPAEGVVYGLPRRVGEAVVAGEVVANVIDPGHRRLRARVDQPDLPHVAPGQRLIVGFNGLPRERWEGRVTFVAPGLREAGGRDVGEVLGEIADPQGKLPANAAVDVQIVTGQKSGTLVVPRASVLRDGDRRFVYLLETGRARRREVQVGLLGLTQVEILGGLREQDAVILPGSAPLSEGLRVRARKG